MADAKCSNGHKVIAPQIGGCDDPGCASFYKRAKAHPTVETYTDAQLADAIAAFDAQDEGTYANPRFWLALKRAEVLLREQNQLADLLAWAERNEVRILPRRTKVEYGWELWWSAVRHGKALTHPYGNIRDLLTKAREATKGRRGWTD